MKKNQNLSEFEKNRLLSLFSSGFSILSISKRFGISYSFLYRQLSRDPGYVELKKRHLSQKDRLRSQKKPRLKQKYIQPRQKNPSKDALYQRKLRLYRRNKGLCLSCGGEVDLANYKFVGVGKRPSGARCEACNKKRRKKMRIKAGCDLDSRVVKGEIYETLLCHKILD